MAEGGGEGFETLEGIGGDMQVWDEGTLSDKLSDAEQAGIRKGNTYIYPLWKALLNEWFKVANSKVYLVTPFLDEKRLKDVCRIILYHEAEDKLAAFLTREECDKINYKPITLTTLKKKVKNKLVGRNDPNRGRLDEIFSRVRQPSNGFHAKFMCCIEGDEANVLVTSANFSWAHFNYDNLDSVHYIRMKKEDCERRFLQPLGLN